MALLRRVTRTILNTTETTIKTHSINSDTLDFALLTTESFYIGYHGKFASRYIQVDTANTNASVMSVQYWDGDSWEDVDDFIDQTSFGGKTLAQSGFISWVNKNDWKLSSQTGIDTEVEFFWIKIKVSANLSAGTKIQSVLNLYSDDSMLRAYYPELITDANYLPSGRTNFLEQHVSAKDLVVVRSKQRRLIEDESQIVDINAVSLAAVHAVAWIILNPIAASEETRALRDNALSQFNSEMNQLSLDIDTNKDGIITIAERNALSSTRIQRL